MSLIASILIDSVAYGMVLFVISIGLSITLGLMGFVNLAHGVFAMDRDDCGEARLAKACPSASKPAPRRSRAT